MSYLGKAGDESGDGDKGLQGVTSTNPGGPGATAPNPAGALGEHHDDREPGQRDDRNSKEIGPPEGGQPRPEGQPATSGTGVWVGLGLGLLMLASFGSFGLAVAGVVGWFIWQELAEIPAALLAIALFLSAGDAGVSARFKPALRWGALAILCATVLLPFLMIGARTPADGLEPLERPARILGLVWLAAIALAGWRFPPPARLQGLLLTLVIATSRLVVYPATALLTVAQGAITEPGASVVLAPIVLGGIAVGMGAVLLLGAALAWGARALGQRIAPARTIALAALTVLLLQLGMMAAG